ncbi:hypothetical protein RQP46_004453 [Phenoliferia psychrophenolica]
MPASGATATATSSPFGSARKKTAPPPLELNRPAPWAELDTSARRSERGHSSESSPVPTSSAATVDYGSSDVPQRRQPGTGSLSSATARTALGGRSEERDTLSKLQSESSTPASSIAFPSSQSQTLTDTDADADADADEPREDDTAHTFSSIASSSSTGALSTSTSSEFGTTNSSFGGARQYTGLGLGLPFSMSAAANLSSVSPTGRSSASNTPGVSAFSDQDRAAGPSTSPYGERSRSSTSGTDSPVTDRSKLIGLGELATPRWTSGVLERRWGAPLNDPTTEGAPRDGEEDEFDFLASYSSEREPVATSRAPDEDASSPTLSKPSGVPYADHPSFTSSMVTSASSTSLLNATTTGLINFGKDPASGAPRDVRRLSNPRRFSTYSLDAVSITEEIEGVDRPQSTSRRSSQLGVSDAPSRQYEHRMSVGAANSAPNTAAGSSWTVGPGEASVVGLGFDYDNASAGAALAAAAAALDPSSRRTSSASGGSSSRRSSTGRPTSSDGKPRQNHLRRVSASKSGFAHLPPSPAASSVTHVPAAAPSTPALPGGTGQTPPSRTPDVLRHSQRSSFHAHHSSPSIIAASILRQTREPAFEGVDIDQVAANDSGTADALRKLDGLMSPRLSKGYSAPTSQPRSRTTSREAGTPPAKDDVRARRRTRSSGGSTTFKDGEHPLLRDPSSLGSSTRSMPTSSSSSPGHQPSPATSSQPFAYPALAQSTASRSPVSPQASKVPIVPPPGSSPAAYEVPFPSAAPFKRGSSSSASLTAGTSTSASGSRDSTSGTSISGSSFTTSAARSASLKNRRGSVGSDVSSTQSTGDAVPHEAAVVGEAVEPTYIPPVPPLPKDWESYRPSTGGTSISSTQNSPRFDASRRPSDSGSFHQFPSSNDLASSDPAHLSPRAADMEPSLSSSSSSAKTPTRKWSISSAFKTKSPKPSSSSIKESTSYTDLASAASRARESTSSYGSEHLYPRRLAASTNDIVGLASSSSDRESTGSKMRNTFRTERTASITSRPRTSSASSNSTTRTAVGSQASTAPPAVVTTSPGRSRSSLLSPRRTPSGIPFFSRKSSTGSVVDKTPSPSHDKEKEKEKLPAAPAADEKTNSGGRKSILGLNFLRSTASRRDKDKVPPSPVTATKRQTFSNVPPPREPESRPVDEFGRRASVASRTTSMITRKRGKVRFLLSLWQCSELTSTCTFWQTLGSVDDGPADAKPLALPPMQMSALSAATVRRVDSLNSSISSMSSIKSASGSSRLQTPSSKTNKLQESVKANLPTIAGSPSLHAFPSVQDRPPLTDSTRSSSPPPKSQTPTKIPRLNQRPAANSPRLTPRASDSSLNGNGSSSPAATSSLNSRRLSHYSTTPDASSILSMSTNSIAPSENDAVPSEFGIVNREPGLAPGEKTLSTRRRLDSEPSGIPRSRSTAAGTTFPSRTPLESSTSSARAAPSAGTTALPRANRRKSLMAGEDAKALAAQALASPRMAAPRTSTTSIANRGLNDSTSSLSTLAGSSALPRRPISKETTTATVASLSRRSSAAATTTNSTPADSLASSRSSRNIASKMAIPSRISKSSVPPSITATAASEAGSGRSSASSQNQSVSEEQLRGDEEMAAYVRRQHAKKLAAGISSETIRKMFEFPDPTEPLPSLQARDAVSLYGRCLSEYEREEIRDYEDIYFVGPNCDKKPASKDNPTNNFGFDDERGDYLLVPHDHIRFRYEAFDVLGKGSFGQVLQCRDHKTGDMVAIKIIRNKKRFHHQALVEIKVLENLVKWDPDEKHYVIRMVDSFTFRGHLCIVTELLSINLYELVKANSFAGFSTTLIRRFTMQILGSLALLRHQRVVHCDLKPENILLKHPAKSAIKVIDFGSSCFENEKVYTYIQSRFYRSPEVILGMNYHMAIDMWSLGCIIAEMFTGYPIFPGENEQEQLACIMEVMGLPEKYLVDRSSRKRLFFDSTGAPRPVVNSKGRRRRPGTKTLAQVLKSDDELFVDFIAKCLTWDPDRRLKPEPALRRQSRA